MCDEKGNIIDGDQIIAALAIRWKNKKMLKGGVVGTLMSNYGLEKFFNGLHKTHITLRDHFIYRQTIPFISHCNLSNQS